MSAERPDEPTGLSTTDLPPPLRRALEDVAAERTRQEEVWGDQRDRDFRTWLAILVEEVGETAQAILQRDPTALRREIVQVAAVAVAMIEAYDRHLSRSGSDGE